MPIVYLAHLSEKRKLCLLIVPCAQVIWVNPRKILISHSDRRTIDDHRISVERPYIKEWNLLIRQVRFNDSGTYECRINTKPKQIKKVNLTVLGNYAFLDFLLG